MAHYENLPIYKAALDLAIYIEKIVRFFSRYHKYTIGTDLRDTSRRILVLAGTLDPRIANTIGYLAGHLIRAFEVAELEGKVEEVRAVLLDRKPIKKG
jgi:hypothetical protein